MLKEAFGGEYPTLENWQVNLAPAFSDSFFAAIGAHTSRKMAIKSKNPVYAYEFSHPSSFGLLDLFFAGMPKLIARVNNTIPYKLKLHRLPNS